MLLFTSIHFAHAVPHASNAIPRFVRWLGQNPWLNTSVPSQRTPSACPGVWLALLSTLRHVPCITTELLIILELNKNCLVAPFTRDGDCHPQVQSGHAHSFSCCLCCFCTKITELNTCDRDHMACKAENIYSLALSRSWLTPALDCKAVHDTRTWEAQTICG